MPVLLQCRLGITQSEINSFGCLTCSQRYSHLCVTVIKDPVGTGEPKASKEVCEHGPFFESLSPWPQGLGCQPLALGGPRALCLPGDAAAL